MLPTEAQATIALTRTGLAGRPRTVRAKNNLHQQYISNYNPQFARLNNFFRVLAPAIDEVQFTLGLDYYRRMLHTDAQVWSSLNVLIAAVIGRGIQVQPAIGDPDHEDRARALEIRDHVRDNIRNLQTPLTETLREMLLALAYGYKFAELVWRDGDDPKSGKPRLYLDDVIPKPQDSARFIMDRYGGLMCLVARNDNGSFPTISMIFTDGVWTPLADDVLIAPEKIALLTAFGEDGDPRGNSVLRSAQPFYWMKQQAEREWLKLLARFAMPGIVGFTGETIEDDFGLDDDPATVDEETPEEVMVDHLMNLQNAGVAAFSFGSKVQVLEATTNGEAFQAAIDHYDRQMVTAILWQTLATQEGRYMARAAATTHQDILGLGVVYIKEWLAAMVYEQIVKRMVRYNFGDDDARELTPLITIEDTEPHDFASNADAVAALTTSGFILTPEQIVAISRKLGLPSADVEVIAAAMLAQQAFRASQQPGAGDQQNNLAKGNLPGKRGKESNVKPDASVKG